MPKHWMIGLICVVVLPAAYSPKATTPCLLGAPAATQMVAKVVEQLTEPDSVDVVAAGLPYNPTNATIEDSASVCAWVIDSVNARTLRADSNATVITEAFVVRVGNFKVFTADHPWPVSSYQFFEGNGAFVTELLLLD
ncbi:MAG: hypothetical protein H0W15_01350 [Gemmatimonadales bacterium]|nr:hypothetical protein [Gemmatimonadales bacterium]